VGKKSYPDCARFNNKFVYGLVNVCEVVFGKVCFLFYWEGVCRTPCWISCGQSRLVDFFLLMRCCWCLSLLAWRYASGVGSSCYTGRNVSSPKFSEVFFSSIHVLLVAPRNTNFGDGSSREVPQRERESGREVSISVLLPPSFLRPEYAQILSFFRARARSPPGPAAGWITRLDVGSGLKPLASAILVSGGLLFIIITNTFPCRSCVEGIAEFPPLKSFRVGVRGCATEPLDQLVHHRRPAVNQPAAMSTAREPHD
jgi:hypothetical protein